MKLFEGKTPTERNKIIAAGALGVMCLIVLYFAFGRGFFSSSSSTTTVKVSTSPSPATSSTRSTSTDRTLPTLNEQSFQYQTTAIDYRPGSFYAPDPGRNIFAFYEPPPPCPTCPTPFKPTPEPPTPTPTPLPPMRVTIVLPQNVYAGSRAFRLEVNGDKFEPDARIYLSQTELPTSFISPQKLVADVPASFITSAGPRQIIVQTPDGTKYSDQVIWTVLEPPKPQFKYIGMIARQRANNDTAYFLEEGKPTPMSARLGDVVAGRFRLVSISSDETVFKDVSLGFPHKLPLFRPPPGSVTSSGGPPSRGGRDNDGYVPYNPGFQGTPVQPVTSIPGIPDNIPRYIPPNNNTNTNQKREKKADQDDEDDDGDGVG